MRPELGIPEAVDRVIMHGLEKDRTRRYQKMAAFEQDIDRLLAGEMDVALDDAAGEQPSPLSQRQSRWPWHLAVAAVLALGIGSAAMLARTGKEIPAPAVLVPATLPVPKASVPLQIIPELTKPMSEVVPSTPSEHVRHLGKSHPARPSAAVEPPPKKSKADDKIAPSPYTAPKAP
jgi:hypothetical protein